MLKVPRKADFAVVLCEILVVTIRAVDVEGARLVINPTSAEVCEAVEALVLYI